MLRQNWWLNACAVSLVCASCATQQIEDDGGTANPSGDVSTVETSNPATDTGETDGFTITDQGFDQDAGVTLDTGTVNDNGAPPPEDTGVFPVKDVPPPPRDVPIAPADVPIAQDVQVARDVVTVTDTGVDPCSAATACGDCASLGACGWCGASGRCFAGTSAGPTGATCASGWAWTPSACMSTSDPCALRSTCGDCTAQAACGWCKATRQCMTGTGTGPTTGTCAGGDWAWTQSQCSAPTTDSCRTTTGCASCRQRSTCGWCDDSGTCHSGTSSGPTDRACASSSWRWSWALICL